MKKLVILFIAIAGFAVTSQAQVTKTATASATIVAPIGLVKTVDLDFGNVAVSAALGTVAMSPAGVRTPLGGVTLPATAGSPAAASFTVTGTSGYTYSITLPLVATTVAFGAFNMSVDTWTSNPSGTGTLVAGTQTLNVGATLHVAGNQNPGLYTSAVPFSVTVNYN